MAVKSLDSRLQLRQARKDVCGMIPLYSVCIFTNKKDDMLASYGRISVHT